MTAKRIRMHGAVRNPSVYREVEQAVDDAEQRSDAALIGTKTRSGLKMVMTLSRIRKNLRAVSARTGSSTARCARRASTGSNVTL